MLSIRLHGRKSRPQNCIEAANSPFERRLRNSTNGPFRNLSHKLYIYVARTIELADVYLVL